ncbi:hypothetical protein GQ55_7G066900 [Panicum hallii var. hallii]|uniref:Uncharacterized protein n=1 Tax=Panicum hallii var. hallii TaxID=1504633 RepID=A0A2T7CSS1_9POAL|nr:hypothetical protein GQ55_7G066900 [Panicum hallii var. hallii]
MPSRSELSHRPPPPRFALPLPTSRCPSSTRCWPRASLAALVQLADPLTNNRPSASPARLQTAVPN